MREVGTSHCTRASCGQVVFLIRHKQTAEKSSPCSLERAVTVAVVPAAAGSTCSVRRDDVDEEVEEVGVVHGRGDVLPVHGAALAVERGGPGAARELGDEELARLGEHNGRLAGDHPGAAVRGGRRLPRGALHDLLDARQRQRVRARPRRHPAAEDPRVRPRLPHG
uniref:Uncharacterized protein n=1 Tax=Zea mays TaxID=4577 RepID=A0A804UHR2_MAIZE